MGARTPANAKEKRTTVTCEECQREFVTVQALKSHTIAKHPDKYKQMQNSESENKDEKKTAFVPPTSRVSKRLQQKKSVDKDTVFEDNSSSVSDGQKVVFECPQCLKVFPVYFSAFKHIQKRHGEDKDGNPISPDSLNLIKPVRKEISITCDKLVHKDRQSCENISSSLREPHEKGMYSCLRCKQSFQSVTLFDDHVARTHNENVDILMFGNMNEFLAWKTKIESQEHVKYLSVSKTTQRQYYQCNYVSPKNSVDITHLCPSIIVSREFPKGIHVRYYKDHYIHKTPTQLKDKDEMFNSLLKKDDDDQLYIKFKNLLTNIALNAARINITNLKKLYSAALEMQTCLKNYMDPQENTEVLKIKTHVNSLNKADKESIGSIDTDNQKETSIVDIVQKSTVKETDATNTKSMNDDQISKVLEARRASARLKRKNESTPAVESKKQKSSETKQGLKENDSVTKDAKFDSPKITKLPPVIQSPSFNDTYKQFIDDTLKPKDKKESSPRKVVKKEIVKTKIGQFIQSPKKSVQMKIDSENVDSVDKKKVTNMSPQSSISNVKLEEILQSPEGLMKVDSDDIVDKKKIKGIIKPPQTSVANLNSEHDQSPKKTVQIMDDLENVKSVDKKIKGAPIKSPQTSIANLNLDHIKYEVVEQENDCNILVLKI